MSMTAFAAEKNERWLLEKAEAAVQANVMRKAVRYYEQRLAMYSFSKSTEAVKLILAQGYYFSNKQQKAIHLLNDVIASNADSD